MFLVFPVFLLRKYRPEATGLGRLTPWAYREEA